MARDASSVLSKWQRNLSAASESYKQGIQGTNVNPMAVAASRLDLYRQKTAEAVDSGRMAQRLNATPVEYWRSQALSIGAANLARGAQKGAQKMGAFINRAVPFWDQLSKQIQGMPKGSREAAIARQQAAMDAMKQFSGRNW
jgi:hypothetical protein